ncbi:MAG: dihydrofolate reductase family protein [Mariprofundaceae bacterium]|nr:dihydrofolate reductase family protein [Mariprofundaceae bacterium]
MSVQCLFPESKKDIPLHQLYLGLNLHRQAMTGDVLIYANYIASLDGRISLRNEQTGEFSVPDSIGNKRDWRLYQELAAQADVMITSARYFRQLDKGCAQDLLPVGQEPDYADLAAWRAEQCLKPQADVVIVSASLDIPLDAVKSLTNRRVWVLTVQGADATRRKLLEDSGMTVVQAGTGQVQGKALKDFLIEHGYRSAYMIAGPAIHHTLLAAGVLNRLFLTTHFSLLGNNEFHTILQGDMPARKVELYSLYLDNSGGQMFGQYEIKGNKI